MRPTVLFAIAAASAAFSLAQNGALARPGFHHLHLNSVDPDAAIAYYTQQFRSTAKGTFAGQPALKARNVWVLFNKVNKPPAIEPQTAYWHFGWNVPDSRKNRDLYRQKGVSLKPLFTGEGDQTVDVSSDTWPGAGGTLGRTRSEINEAKAKNIQPTRVGGFGYLNGPDRAIVEYAGNYPVERFNHVHMYQEDPLCAQLWYQKHLLAGGRENAPPLAADITETHCKVPIAEKGWPGLEREGLSRLPTAGVLFDDVAMNWYSRQGSQPLAPTRGHLSDHVGLSVTNLDAWIAKLRGEGVKFLGKPYKIGDFRAVMIEGPSREAIELIETH